MDLFIHEPRFSAEPENILLFSLSLVLCFISSLTYFALMVTGILAGRGVTLLMVPIGLAATYRQECLYLPVALQFVAELMKQST